MLLSYVLDHNRPGAEVIVKEGDVCLTREDFWSLGLPQSMESNIGNTCLKMVQEATQRHVRFSTDIIGLLFSFE
ncbi:Tyrosine-protein phosphatase 10D [Dissostichus eleginoides]|uniref:Tyrosine-protein phosphatase 10D n=1 Tax=Dissostichus eleginoides TaxID=100907 RepID=A0AAD9B7U5_DISEL|nr:Tyrosine-protein phosphatase 10D [Dissostichus eleginoides]